MKKKRIRPANKERAGWAMAAVASFIVATGMQDEDLDTILTDLLADLMHACDNSGLDFDDLVRIARYHHEAEQSERTELS